MEKPPLQKTPLMEMFLDAQREKFQEQLRNAKKLGSSREEQAGAIAIHRMTEASLDLALVVSGDDAQNNTEAMRTIIPVPIWIEPSKPIRFAPAPFLVAAVSLTCSGDPDAIQASLRDAPPLVQKALASLHRFVDRWIIDVVDAAGEIVFGMVYELGTGWRSSQEVELCPWQQCYEQQATFVECDRCKALRERMENYVCAILTREGIENAGSAKALEGLKFASSSTTAKPDGGSETRLPPQDQTRHDLLLERYRANRLNDVQQSIKLSELQGDMVMAEERRTLQKLYSTLLDETKKIYLDKGTTEKIPGMMKSIAHGDRSVPSETFNDPTRTLDRPLWIECEKPMTIAGVPLIIQGLLFARPGDPVVKKAMLLQGHDPRLLDQKALQFWGVDLVSDRGVVTFNFIWTGRTWSINLSHVCPFGQCTTTGIGRGQACQLCQVCYKWAAMWLGTVLLARTGYFEEIRLEERTLRAERVTTTTAGPHHPREIVEHKFDVMTLNTAKAEAPAPVALRRLQASGLPAFLDAYKSQERKRIQELRLHSINPFEIRAAQLLSTFQIEVLKSSKVLLVPDHAQGIIEQKIAEYGGVDGPRIPALLPQVSRNLWIKLARPLSIYGTAWKAGAFFFSQSNDPRILDRVMPLFEHDAQMREAAQMLGREQSEYAVDAIDTTDNTVKFTVAYQPGERFMPSDDSHQCHYHTPSCGQHGQICPPCKKVVELVSGYFSMILLARRGEFAEIVIIEETERVKREEPELPGEQPRQPSKKAARKKHREKTTWEDRTISTMVVNVSQKVVIEEHAGEETRSGHPNWMRLHKEEDIESYEAVQPAYTRNGKRIVPQVPRKWYKLKQTTSVEELQ